MISRWGNKLDCFAPARYDGFTLAEGTSYRTLLPTKVKFAFTLAEILITLGIIGVVAAMTIPSLINSYNIRVTETRLHKFYSVFNQAIKLSIVDNGEPEGWDEYWVGAKSSATQEQADAAVQKYLLPYMKISHKKRVWSSYWRTLYFLPDGSAFGFPTYVRDVYFYPKDAEKCLKRPSAEINGVCVFSFIFYPVGEGAAWDVHNKQGPGLEPYLYGWNGQKSLLYTGTNWSCDNEGLYCTALIKQNGWKIPKDYPRKIRY